MCVICLQLLANEAMKLAKLKRHLLTKHLEYSNKPKDFFIRKGEEYFHQRTRLTNVDQLSARRHIPFVMIVAVIATIWNIGGLWWPKTLLRSFICVHLCLCFLCVPSPVSRYVPSSVSRYVPSPVFQVSYLPFTCLVFCDCHFS